jgi:hypothetical protein
LVYYRKLFTKKQKTAIDEKLIDDLQAQVFAPAYRGLEPDQKKVFTAVWEDKIVKENYDYWRTHGTSSKFEWWSKMTPQLHLKVILDKIEDSTKEIESPDISGFANVAAY